MDLQWKLVTPETVDRLLALPESLRHAVVPSALSEAGPEIHAAIVARLSGPQNNVGKGFNKRSSSPGEYPVNVVTGHLRRNQRLVPPGRSGLSLTQIAFANTAVYSAVVHDGEDGNAPRPFIADGLEDEGMAVDRALGEWIDRVT